MATNSDLKIKITVDGKEGFKSVGDLNRELGNTGRTVKDVRKEINTLKNDMVNWKSGGLDLSSAAIEKIKDRLKVLGKELNDLSSLTKRDNPFTEIAAGLKTIQALAIGGLISKGFKDLFEISKNNGLEAGKFADKIDLAGGRLAFAVGQSKALRDFLAGAAEAANSISLAVGGFVSTKDIKNAERSVDNVNIQDALSGQRGSFFSGGGIAGIGSTGTQISNSALIEQEKERRRKLVNELTERRKQQLEDINKELAVPLSDFSSEYELGGEKGRLEQLLKILDRTVDKALIDKIRLRINAITEILSPKESPKETDIYSQLFEEGSTAESVNRMLGNKRMSDSERKALYEEAGVNLDRGVGKNFKSFAYLRYEIEQEKIANGAEGRDSLDQDLGARIENNRKIAEDFSNRMTDVASGLTSGPFKVLGDALTGHAKDFRKNMIEAIRQTVAELISSGFVSLLSSAIGGKSVGLFGTIFGSFAGGADFYTKGNTLLRVGDNPGGIERVTVTPISGIGKSSFSSGMASMAGGGNLYPNMNFSMPASTGSSVRDRVTVKILAKGRDLVAMIDEGGQEDYDNRLMAT